MNLLILNGRRSGYPSPASNLAYRGTYRAHPTFCDALSPDHEVNRLFAWFLEEGGELGVVHDLDKARRFTELQNRCRPDRHFELVEVTQGKTPSELGGKFLGFD